MYQQFFYFKSTPFSISPDPHFIYMSEDHQEGLAHLLYGINQGGGFVTLTGEVGTGKTTLCYCLLEQLPDKIDIALVLNPKLNTVELLATVCDELQITYDQDKLTLKNLVDSLNKHLLATHASGRRTVLMIDEAQNLSLDVLEQIRLLTNLETRETKLLQIILVGQPELKQILEQDELRQLNQRITARYHLNALSYRDTEKYIKHRLTVCGGDAKIFTRRAIKQVYKLTGGIPRLINILSDRALLGAYVTNTHTVTTTIIKKAAEEVFNSSPNSYFTKTLLAFILLACMAITIHFYVLPKPLDNHVILASTFQKPVEKETQPPAKQQNFISAVKEQNITLNAAISKLAKLWNKEISQETGCKEIEKAGLRCLLDKSGWNKLIALNRPVILELSPPESEKIYALLLGFKQENPIFYGHENLVFSVAEVLTFWDGYFLMLWQPVVDNIAETYLGQSSGVVPWIRKQLTENKQNTLIEINSDYFDENLKTEVIKFQQQHNLTTDGIVGPRTFIHLSNNKPQNKLSTLKLDY